MTAPGSVSPSVQTAIRAMQWSRWLVRFFLERLYLAFLSQNRRYRPGCFGSFSPASPSSPLPAPPSNDLPWIPAHPGGRRRSRRSLHLPRASIPKDLPEHPSTSRRPAAPCSSPAAPPPCPLRRAPTLSSSARRPTPSSPAGGPHLPFFPGAPPDPIPSGAPSPQAGGALTYSSSPVRCPKLSSRSKLLPSPPLLAPPAIRSAISEPNRSARVISLEPV
jgi:hypothetical protein